MGKHNNKCYPDRDYATQKLKQISRDQQLGCTPVSCGCYNLNVFGYVYILHLDQVMSITRSVIVHVITDCGYYLLWYRVSLPIALDAAQEARMQSCRPIGQCQPGAGSVQCHCPSSYAGTGG